jgi:hypothetical protein
VPHHRRHAQRATRVLQVSLQQHQMYRAHIAGAHACRRDSGSQPTCWVQTCLQLALHLRLTAVLQCLRIQFAATSQRDLILFLLLLFMPAGPQTGLRRVMPLVRSSLYLSQTTSPCCMCTSSGRTMGEHNIGSWILVWWARPTGWFDCSCLVYCMGCNWPCSVLD